ncbi:hypothetical protein L6V77_29715 [Myxococcota bacterium]|nr:hypothetical protein [Myxococcota bacterium]
MAGDRPEDMNPRDPDPETDVDALIDRYVREAQAELAAGERVIAAEKARLHAAFEAGAPLLTLIPVELWDPVDLRSVRVPGGTVLRVAEHEGDILLGTLTDNAHSLGVVYEEAHRWTARKYFLPLATLCHPARVRTDALAAERAAEVEAPLPERVKGLEVAGEDAETRRAVSHIEDLAERDDRATLPRGTLIILQRGGEARDPATGETVPLPAGTRCEVTAAVGDFRDRHDAVAPPIPVRVGERALTLDFTALRGLDMRKDVLSPRAQELAAEADAARRRTLQRLVGFGLGAAVLTWDGVSYARKQTTDETEARRDLLAWLVPQLGLLYSYFTAGGKYWFDLRGALFALDASGCLADTKRIAAALRPIAESSGQAFGVYEAQFYRRVHVGWTETKHYRTDKDGKRHYTHSTWSKDYRTMWVEPPGLGGQHAVVEGWRDGDAHRLARAQRLLDERIFDLLASKAEHAERDFSLARQTVPFGRDASISALSAALCTMPPAFYDDFIGYLNGRASSPVRPDRELVPYQKNLLLTAGAVAGIVLAERHRRALEGQLRRNKAELGQQLETQIARVPTLSFEAAWDEFMGGPAVDALPGAVEDRASATFHIARTARSFTYTYGSGWDNGRSLDSIHVDAEPVRQTFTAVAPRWAPLAAALATPLREPQVRVHLTRVLRNAVGTEILDAQMRADRGEAEGGGFKQALWYAAPVWGAAILDGAVKALR